MRVEKADGLRCELGHLLNKYFRDGQKFGHMLLCPICDREYVMREFEEERQERPVTK